MHVYVMLFLGDIFYVTSTANCSVICLDRMQYFPPKKLTLFLAFMWDSFFFSPMRASDKNTFKKHLGTGPKNVKVWSAKTKVFLQMLFYIAFILY